MTVNRLDNIYRSVVLTKYFVKGWGKTENLKKIFEWRKILSNRDVCFTLVPSDYPVTIDKEVEGSDYYLIDGHFVSPLVHYLPDVLPEECHKAYFQFVLPKKWRNENYKPVCIHLAGTGDHYYWRRRTFFAKPLIKEGCIGSVLLENPFYGQRKPKDQVRSILHNVSDIFVMGGCLILESLVLFHYCERMGYGPLGITGVSMGGHNASLAATNWPKPLVIVPCLSGSTASVAFTQGAISGAIDWKMLEKQFHSDTGFKNEIVKMLSNYNDDAFRAGQQFAKHLSGTTATTENDNLLLWTKRIDENGGGPVLTTETSSPNVDDNVVDFLKNTAKQVNVDIEECLKNDFHINDEHHKSQKTTLLSKITSPSSLNFPNMNISSFYKSNDKKIDQAADMLQINEREAFNFMRGIMDECTHLKNYSVPVDTSLCIATCAKDDGYVPTGKAGDLKEIWSNAEVRYVEGGHVSAYLRHMKEFRKAIIDGFKRYNEKYG